MMSETKQSTTEVHKNPSEAEEETIPDEISPDEKWLIRECDVYKDEYDECTSFKGRFHQMFIYGVTLDCNQWKKDYDNCCKWTDKNDVRAGLAVVESEKTRRLERLRAHYSNNTWKKREHPPPDWDKPLPEWMVKRDENTYLAQKAKEIREGKNIEEDKGFCSIM